MRDVIESLPDRDRAWNRAMSASPGDLSLTVPAADIDGAIPPALFGGRLWSNGPGWTLFGDRLAHPFDGHGYVRRFSFNADGSVSLDARFVQTAVYTEEAQAGRLLVRGFATNTSDRFWENMGFRGRPRNVANTTIYRWGGHVLVGWEAGAPHALDPETLETLGEHTFDGQLADQATLAHMLRDPATGRLLLCSVAPGRDTALIFREVDAEGTLVQTRTGTIAGMAFAHDFAFTPRWYVLGGNPLSIRPLQLARMMLGTGTMLGSVRTDLSQPGAIVLVPRDAQGETVRVALPEPAYVVHFVNAFERDGATIIDACVFSDFTFGEEFGYTGPTTPLDLSRPESRGTQKLYRITIPDGATEATWQQLVPHGVDFPRILPDHAGQPAPFMVGATRADTRYSDPFDSIIRVDLEQPDAEPVLWTAPKDVFVGEPIPVPGSPDHVVVLLSDGLKEETTLAVFEADGLGKGPMARVRVPLLPVGFHGDWEG